MATLWAIKAQLTKRLCGAFSKWRLAARLATSETENEKKMLAVWKESEEAIRNARAAGSAVGGDAASKVWMGTAMKLLELQRKRERAASFEGRGGGGEGGGLPPTVVENSPVNRRAMQRRTALVLPKTVADIDLDPSKFTSEQYQHVHDADGAAPASAPLQLRGAFFEDDGEPFRVYSDSDEEIGGKAASSSSNHYNRRGNPSALDSQSYSSNGSGHIPDYQTPTGNLHMRRMQSNSGSAASTTSSVVGGGRGRRRRDVTSRDIQRTYRDQHDRMATARKMYSLKGLRARSASPGSMGHMIGLPAASSHSKRYGRSEHAPLQHFVSISNTGSKYSRTHNALWAHNSAKLQNFWGSDYTKAEMDTSGNTFKHSLEHSRNNSRNSSRSSSPTHAGGMDRSRSSSAPTVKTQEFSSFKSTAEWASYVLNSSPMQQGRPWHDPHKSTRSNSSSSRNRGIGSYSFEGHFMAETAASGAHHAHTHRQNKRQWIKQQPDREYSSSNAHFLSDGMHRGRTASPGGYRKRAPGSHGGGMHARKQPQERDVNRRAQSQSSKSYDGAEPSYSILRDGGNQLHSIASSHGQGALEGGNSLQVGGHHHQQQQQQKQQQATFMAPTASSLHHTANQLTRQKIYRAHVEEYSPAHSHSKSHIKPVKSHFGTTSEQYLENDDGMDVATYQKYVADLAAGNGTWSTDEVAEAEGEIEQLLAAIDEAALAGRNALEAAAEAPAKPNDIPPHNSAMDILEKSLERKRHAKSAVSERMAALAAKAAATNDSNPKGNTNVNTSTSIQAQTSQMFDEVEAAISSDGNR